jgi:hypothetical protein
MTRTQESTTGPIFSEHRQQRLHTWRHTIWVLRRTGLEVGGSAYAAETAARMGSEGGQRERLLGTFENWFLMTSHLAEECRVK